MKIISWNINGLRSWLSKGRVRYVAEEDPDIFCMQELKCNSAKCYANQFPQNYQIYINAGTLKGRSGVAVLTKIPPISVITEFGVPEFDQEGRMITLEYDHFYLVNLYAPNSGDKLKRLDYRMRWEDLLLQYLSDLQHRKEVIVTGDLNVAHTELDIARPKGNEHRAGFTVEERQLFSRLLDTGFVDTFRALHPNTREYTFWTYLFAARRHNIGWRLDYFLVSANMIYSVQDSFIQTHIMGSDHCPIGIEL